MNKSEKIKINQRKQFKEVKQKKQKKQKTKKTKKLKKLKKKKEVKEKQFNKMNMIKAIFFDFDGVLTLQEDDVPQTCKSLSRITHIKFEKLYREYKPYNQNLMEGNITHPDLCKIFSSKFDYEFSFKLFNQTFLDTTKNKEILNLIKNLKIKGFKIGLITDNAKDRIDSIKNKFKMNELFDSIIISSQIGSTKKNNLIFDKALDSLQIKAKESIFIDNSQKNLDVASKRGFKTILHNSSKDNINNLNEKILNLI